MSGQDAASSSREVEEVSNYDVIFAYRDTQKKELQSLIDRQAEELRALNRKQAEDMRAFMSKQSMDFCSFCDKLAEKTSKRVRSVESSKDDTAKEAQGAGSNDDDSNSRKKQRSSVLDSGSNNDDNAASEVQAGSATVVKPVVICIDDDDEPDVVPEVKLEPVEAVVTASAIEAEVAPKAVEAVVAASAIEAEVAPKAVEAVVAASAIEAEVAPKAVEPEVAPKVVEPGVVHKAIALEVAMPDTESEADEEAEDPGADEEADESNGGSKTQKAKPKRSLDELLEDSIHLIGNEIHVDLKRHLNYQAWLTLKRVRVRVSKLPGHIDGSKCSKVKGYIPGPDCDDYASTFSGFMNGTMFVFPLDVLWGKRVMKALDDVIEYVDKRRKKVTKSQGGSAKQKQNHR